MNTYKITINGAEVSEWNIQEGMKDSNRFYKDVGLGKVIEVNNLTRADVLDCVKELLYIKEELNEDSLFDGNEDFFCIQVLEDGDGFELDEGEEEGYLVEYFVDVQKIEHVKATNIL